MIGLFELARSFGRCGALFLFAYGHAPSCARERRPMGVLGLGPACHGPMERNHQRLGGGAYGGIRAVARASASACQIRSDVKAPHGRWTLAPIRCMLLVRFGRLFAEFIKFDAAFHCVARCSCGPLYVGTGWSEVHLRQQRGADLGFNKAPLVV